MQDTAADLLPVQLHTEPLKWYARFCQFCLVGPNRTLEGFWRTAAKGSKAKRPPSSWYHACEKWEWRKRAAEFDRARAERELAERQMYRAAELASRARRIQEFGNYFDEMLKSRNKAYTPVEIAAVARTYFAASREEFSCSLEKQQQVSPEGAAKPTGFEMPQLEVTIRHEQADGTLLIDAPPQPPPKEASFGGKVFEFSNA